MRTVQSLWKLGWKSQSWRARNQQGLLVAAGNFTLEFSMEEQLDPCFATSSLLLLLLLLTSTTSAHYHSQQHNSQLRTVCS